MRLRIAGCALIFALCAVATQPSLAVAILLIGVGIPTYAWWRGWLDARAERRRLLADCHEQHEAWRREDDMTAVFGRYRPAVFHQPEFTDMAATVRHDALREMTAATLGRTVDELDQMPKPVAPAPPVVPEAWGIFDMLNAVFETIDDTVSELTGRASASEYTQVAEEAVRVRDQLENQRTLALERAQARIDELERDKRELQQRTRRVWDTVVDVSRGNDAPGRGEGWPWSTIPYPSTYRRHDAFNCAVCERFGPPHTHDAADRWDHA